MTSSPPAAAPRPLGKSSDPAEGTRYRVLGALSFSHFLNDMMQSLVPAPSRGRVRLFAPAATPPRFFCSGFDRKCEFAAL